MAKCAVFKLLPLATSLAYMCETGIPLYTATEIMHLNTLKATSDMGFHPLALLLILIRLMERLNKSPLSLLRSINSFKITYSYGCLLSISLVS
jgi:hypothetical protein